MWISISSGVLSFSFVFGNTMNNQLQAILLLFVVHPFDVGDRLLLGGPTAAAGGDLVTVEEMSLNKVPPPSRLCGISRIMGMALQSSKCSSRGWDHRLRCCAAAQTVVLRTDGARIWYPNTLLLLVPVLNVTRTDSRRMEFQVHCITPNQTCHFP